MVRISVFLAGLAMLFAVSVQAQNEIITAEAETALQAGQQYFDGKRWRKLWLNSREIIEFGANEQSEENLRSLVPQAKSVMQNEKMRVWQLGRDDKLDSLTRSLRSSESKRFSPVYHLSKRGGPRLALAGNVIVRFKSDQTEQQVTLWAEEKGLSFVRAMPLPRVYLFAADSIASVLPKANEIQKSGEVAYAMPEWRSEAHRR